MFIRIQNESTLIGCTSLWRMVGHGAKLLSVSPKQKESRPRTILWSCRLRLQVCITQSRSSTYQKCTSTSSRPPGPLVWDVGAGGTMCLTSFRLAWSRPKQEATSSGTSLVSVHFSGSSNQALILWEGICDISVVLQVCWLLSEKATASSMNHTDKNPHYHVEYYHVEYTTYTVHIKYIILFHEPYVIEDVFGLYAYRNGEV